MGRRGFTPAARREPRPPGLLQHLEGFGAGFVPVDVPVGGELAQLLGDRRHRLDHPLHLGGQLEVVRLRYTDPIELVGFDLNQLGRRRLAEVRTYDPEGDQIWIDLRLMGSDNLRIDNNLATAELVVDVPALSEREDLVPAGVGQDQAGSGHCLDKGGVVQRGYQVNIFPLPCPDNHPSSPASLPQASV